jgi:large subunit ribosomal protein L4
MSRSSCPEDGKEAFMPTVEVYNQDHEKVDSVDLDSSIFEVDVKEHLFHLMVRYQLAKRRAGTHATKGRSEVSGGGKKPYRQKGTGRARQGTTRAPQWRGGGVVHGPHPRSHAIEVPKKVRRAALKAALTRRVQDGTFWVLDKLQLGEIKTARFKAIMERFGWKRALIVLPKDEQNVWLSARNIQGATLISAEGLNVYDILRHEHIAVTRDELDRIVTRLGR